MQHNENPYAPEQPSERFPSLWGNPEELQKATTSCLARVFMRMFAALLVTAGVSYGVYETPALLEMIIGNVFILIGLLIAQFVLVIILSARVMKMSSAASNFMFFLYAILMGLTLSVIFITYEMGVIFQAFAVSALMFAAMALYGTITRRDLTKIGSICFMGLIGVIIATIINMIFFRNDMLSMVINYIGVLVFVGLTAYDTQRIKRMLAEANEGSHEEVIKRISVMGALILYLDFLNLFLKILSILGRRK